MESRSGGQSTTGTGSQGTTERSEPGSRDMSPQTGDTSSGGASRDDRYGGATGSPGAGQTSGEADTSASSGAAQESTAGQRSESGSARIAAADSGSMMQPKRASKLIGSEVRGTDGDRIGTLQDVILDQNGQVTHGIVAHGGTLGLGQSLTPVPWGHLSASMQGDAIVLDEKRLENAPKFAGGEWPNLASPTWSQEADQYWTQGGTMRSAEMSTGQQPGTQQQSGTAQQPGTGESASESAATSGTKTVPGTTQPETSGGRSLDDPGVTGSEAGREGGTGTQSGASPTTGTTDAPSGRESSSGTTTSPPQPQGSQQPESTSGTSSQSPDND